MRMRCPHCKSIATIRSSYEVSDLTRESFMACRNTACGHTFAAITEIHRTLSPSSIPNPKVRLPLSVHVRRKDLCAQLKTLPSSDAPPPA